MMDKTLIRGKDVALIVSVLTLAAMLTRGIKKPVIWDQCAEDVRALKPVVTEHSIELAVIHTQFDDIQRSLRSIDRKLNR